MGLIQPLPLPYHTHTANFVDSVTLISMKPNVLHLKKCYPLTSVMYYYVCTYVTFWITTLFLGIFYACLNLLKCLLLLTGYIFDAATKTIKLPKQTANTNYLPFRMF